MKMFWKIKYGKDIKDGRVNPENTDVREEFLRWLEESGFEEQEVWQAIRDGKPLPEEQDTKYAYVYWLWQISEGKVDTTSSAWRYLWKQGFPIDPVDPPTQEGKALFVGGQYDPSTETLRLSFLK